MNTEITTIKGHNFFVIELDEFAWGEGKVIVVEPDTEIYEIISWYESYMDNENILPQCTCTGLNMEDEEDKLQCIHWEAWVKYFKQYIEEPTEYGYF